MFSVANSHTMTFPTVLSLMLLSFLTNYSKLFTSLRHEVIPLRGRGHQPVITNACSSQRSPPTALRNPKEGANHSESSLPSQYRNPCTNSTQLSLQPSCPLLPSPRAVHTQRASQTAPRRHQEENPPSASLLIHCGCPEVSPLHSCRHTGGHREDHGCPTMAHGHSPQAGS